MTVTDIQFLTVHETTPRATGAGSAADSQELDLALVADLLTGNESAWRRFHDRYGRLIHRCIAGVTNRFAPVLGGDEAHEIHATLLCELLANDMRKLRTFDPTRGKRLGSWIGLLATHAAYDHLRSRRADRERTTLKDAELLPSETPDPFDHASAKQRIGIVRAMLAEFSPKDQEFIHWYFEEGLDPEEVAEKMGISVKTVYSKKHKIRTRLEALLSQQKLAA